MFVIQHKKTFLVAAVTIVLVAIGLLSTFGLSFGIDFAGGTIIELSFVGERPTQGVVDALVGEHTDSAFSIREVGEQNILIRTAFLEEEARQTLTASLTTLGDFSLERVSSVGPTVGAELRTKALIALAVAALVIVLYIAYTFRRGEGDGAMKGPSSWKYGLVAIAALVHDVLVPVGIFALLGQVAGFEVDTLFVMALLAIVGYSVNDTIVIFDRIRENLRVNTATNRHEPFAETVGRSLSESRTRSINTSLTTLVVLLALFFVGGATIHSFVLTLIVGVIAGTYSSLFIASPLLVLWEGTKKR